MKSTRLPGKVMLDLHGHTVLWHVLTRCREIPGVDRVACAVPDQPESNILLVEAFKAGADVVLGPEGDVLARYRIAAGDADRIVRVTSDCPMIDPILCGRTLDLLQDNDIAVNNEPRTWAHGLDCEAFTRDALFRASDNATSDYDREHVTPWMRRNLNMACLIGTGDGTPRLTLDTLDDYHRIWEAMRAG